MGFGPPVTPQVIKNLLIVNGVVFLAQLLTRSPAGDMLTQFGAVSPWAVWVDFKFWQPFTYMWLHSPFSPFHIIFNMLMLWMFGSQLALVWGEERFLRYYLACGIGAGVLIATLPWMAVLLGLMPASQSLQIPTLGASGAVMGVILAFSSG
jgi:membrane associated rhomboid family serine protease